MDSPHPRHEKDTPPLNPEPLHRFQYPGKELVIVGTAHVSRDSADLVDRVIGEEKPDTVCVELCAARYEALRQRDKWQEMDIVRVVREKRTALLLAQLLMASVQNKIAQRFHIQPGEEMIRAMARAEETGAELVLADREIRITLLRVWRSMGFWARTKFISEMIFSLFFSEEITEEEIEKLKQQDVLEVALETVGKKLPELKTTLIDERDQFLAHRISHAPGRKIVAVVGAGHVPGIVKNLDRTIDLDALNRIPPPSLWSKWAGWGFTLAILGLFVAGFFASGSRASLTMMAWWAVITAACASAGAILLLAHPFTIAAAALAAPFTTLHPLLAAGWIAGLVEASVRKPQVRDFLALKSDIMSVRGFFRNKITRILLLVAIVNLTTSIGTFIAIPFIMRFI